MKGARFAFYFVMGLFMLLVVVTAGRLISEILVGTGKFLFSYWTTILFVITIVITSSGLYRVAFRTIRKYKQVQKEHKTNQAARKVGSIEYYKNQISQARISIGQLAEKTDEVRSLIGQEENKNKNLREAIDQLETRAKEELANGKIDQAATTIQLKLAKTKLLTVSDHVLVSLNEWLGDLERVINALDFRIGLFSEAIERLQLGQSMANVKIGINQTLRGLQRGVDGLEISASETEVVQAKADIGLDFTLDNIGFGDPTSDPDVVVEMARLKAANEQTTVASEGTIPFPADRTGKSEQTQ